MAKKKAGPKEVCTMTEVCVSAGDDCTEEGRTGRENGCFDDGTDKTQPALAPVEAAPCIEDKCHAYNPKKPHNCRVFPPETDAFTGCPLEAETEEPIAETIADASESIPEVPETISVGGHKTFPRMLLVTLTEEELAEEGAEMSRLIGIWTKAKLDKKAFDRSSKALIDDTEAKYVAIAEAVQAGTEEREVQCYWEYDKEHGTKTLYRCDTGAIVETVNMELLDYDNNTDGSESIKNVEEAFQTDTQQEAPDQPAGEEAEVKGEVATEEESPFTEEISEPALCVCDNLECSNEATVIPGTECDKCIFGVMLPADIGEYPEQEAAA